MTDAPLNGHPDPTVATSWWPIDLAPILRGIEAGEIVGPIPELMHRTDGPALLYPGEVHSLAGEPESGKGWLALAAAAEVIATGGHVLYLDCEDAPASIVSRLLALEITATQILNQFAYIRPTDPFTAVTLDALLARRTYTLAVIDGLSEAYTLLGLDPYNNVDAAKFLAALPRPIAAAGAAVLLIDHVVKAKEGRGRYALGAQHKLAGIAVAYTTDTITTPTRTTPGQIKLKVEKDRHGHVRPHAHAGQVALVHITPSNDGEQVTVDLRPPAAATRAGQFRPTVLMERVSLAVEADAGLSKRSIRETVGGKTSATDLALDLLITEGFIDPKRDGQAHRHHSIRPYRQDHDTPTVTP